MITVLVADWSYPDEDGIAPSHESVVNAVSEEVGTLGESVSIQSVNLGHGADWPFIAATVAGLAGVSAVFFQGKRIEENLDAWLRLGSRLGKVVRRLQRRSQVYLSRTGVWLLIIKYLEMKYGRIENLEYMSDHSIILDPRTWYEEGTPEAEPDRIDVKTLVVNHRLLVVIGMRSTGEVEFVHEFRRRHESIGEWLQQAKLDAYADGYSHDDDTGIG